MKKNNTIRERAREKDVRLWEIAERLNVSEGTFIRKLRRELPPEVTDRILAAIDSVAEEHEKLSEGGRI